MIMRSTSFKLNFRSTLAGLVLTCFALLTGCVPFNKAPLSTDAQSKLFTPKADASVVYIYRDEWLFAAAFSMPINVDNKLLGNTVARSFFRIELPPGEHVIISQSDQYKLPLTTEAGHIYYVWQEVKATGRPTSKLHLMSEAEGQQSVLKCTQIHSHF